MEKYLVRITFPRFKVLKWVIKKYLTLVPLSHDGCWTLSVRSPSDCSIMIQSFFSNPKSVIHFSPFKFISPDKLSNFPSDHLFSPAWVWPCFSNYVSQGRLRVEPQVWPFSRRFAHEARKRCADPKWPRYAFSLVLPGVTYLWLSASDWL